MAAKKKNSAKKAAHGSKTAFVMGISADVPAKDVVAQAKAKGISLSEAYVYNIRSTSKGGAKKPGRGAAKPAGATKSGGMSKTDFVRSLPAGTSYEDAAAKAKAAGIVLSKAYFYVLKSGLKKSGNAPKGKPGRKPRALSADKGLRLTSDNADEQTFLSAVRAMGSERARALIAVVERFERG
jgi:hypothetical protein